MDQGIRDVFSGQISENAGIIHKVVAIYADTREDQEDLYQEILFQSWKSYASFRHDSKFSTWLYRVSLNTALVFRRKDARHSHSHLDESVAPHADDSHESCDDRHALIAAIRTLPKVERMIITLHLDGYTYKEIGEMTGISKDNAGIKIHRIKKKLSETLKQITS